MAETNITYKTDLGTYDLQYEDPTGQNTILTSNILYRHLSQKDIITREDTIRDSFDIVDVKYSRKIITVTGWLISDSQAHLRTLRDNFMFNLKPSEGDLTIDYGSSTIVYKATVQTINVPEEHWQITQLPFNIEFLCEPFGKASSSTTLNWTNITASPTYKTPSITGTYKAKPTITITVVSESNMTAIKFDDVTAGDWIQVSRSFDAGDSLVIDCEDETVKLNGNSEDFTGVFPQLLGGETNSITITISDTGGFNITVQVVYVPTYL